jgi:hypothetical protein
MKEEHTRYRTWFSGFLRHVVLCEGTNVSEERTASIFRAKSIHNAEDHHDRHYNHQMKWFDVVSVQ